MTTTTAKDIHTDKVPMDGQTCLDQITRGGLMTVGASNIRLYLDAVTMNARIHPRRKDGRRAGAARVMQVKITLSSWDTYSLSVSYLDGRKFEFVTHWEMDGIFAEDLPRIFLSLDSGTESR